LSGPKQRDSQAIYFFESCSVILFCIFILFSCLAKSESVDLCVSRGEAGASCQRGNRETEKSLVRTFRTLRELGEIKAMQRSSAKDSSLVLEAFVHGDFIAWEKFR